MEITHHNLRTLNTAFSAAFASGFAGVTPQSAAIRMDVPSTTSEQEYGWLGASTGFREWIGARQLQSLEEHGYTVKNRTFENTVAVKREKIEDDQYGIYTPLVSQLGQDAQLHPDELVFGLLQAGFDTKCFDGQYFFDTDHPVGKAGAAGSVSNFGGGSGTAWYLLDTTRAIKPLIFQKRRDYAFVAKTRLDDESVFTNNEFVWGADARVNVGFGLWQLGYASKQTLDVTSYAAARAAMQGFKSDAGKPLGVRPTLLVVPPSLEKAALDLVQAQRLANGADNVFMNTAKVMVCPWLT